jgi:hypothetical protein
LVLEVFPKNKFDIKESFSGMKVFRKVYEVVDVNRLSECSAVRYWRNQSSDCSNALREVTD